MDAVLSPPLLRRRGAWPIWPGSAGLSALLGFVLLAGCAHTGAPGASGGRAAWRAAGPLLEGAHDPRAQADLLAVRPLVSSETLGDNSVTDILWPLCTWHRRGERLSWRVFPAFGGDTDVDDPASPYFFHILPFYFEGRSRENGTYRALFPLGGTICGLPYSDRVRFFLFPLYFDSQTRDTRTVSWLWPLFLRRQGDEVDQWRFFPFYGQSYRSGEVPISRHFVLWPIWTDAHYEGERVKGDAFVLFPLFGHANLGDERTWMLLPPFISWTRNDAQDYWRLRCPWPLVQFETRGADHVTAFWPLYGERQQPELTRWYFLWPIVRSERMIRYAIQAEHFHVMPFYYSERRAAAPGAPPLAAEERYWRLWPLLSWWRKGETSRLRILELTLSRNSQAIERNWAPFWSLYVRRRDAAGAISNDLLWGLAAWGWRADGAGFCRLFGWPVAGDQASAEKEGAHGNP